MKIGNATQQPGEYLSYTIDYSDSLVDSDTVALASVTATPEGELTIDRISTTDTTAQFWVTGGTHLTRYKVEVTATTAEGRILQDEITLYIKEL